MACKEHFGLLSTFPWKWVSFWPQQNRGLTIKNQTGVQAWQFPGVVTSHAFQMSEKKTRWWDVYSILTFIFMIKSWAAAESRVLRQERRWKPQSDFGEPVCSFLCVTISLDRDRTVSWLQLVWCWDLRLWPAQIMVPGAWLTGRTRQGRFGDMSSAGCTVRLPQMHGEAHAHVVGCVSCCKTCHSRCCRPLFDFGSWFTFPVDPSFFVSALKLRLGAHSASQDASLTLKDVFLGLI